MKKSYPIGILLLILTIFTGCASFAPTTDCAKIDAKGVVTRVIVSDFTAPDGSDYDAAALKTAAETELSAFTAAYEGSTAQVVSCEVKEHKVYLQMTFDKPLSYEQYCSMYNDDFSTSEADVIFRTGSLAELDMAGFSFVDAAGAEANAEMITAHPEYHFCMFNEAIQVYTPSDIVYMSNNATCSGKREAGRAGADGLETCLIIYK